MGGGGDKYLFESPVFSYFLLLYKGKLASVSSDIPVIALG